ncbi:MAG: GTP pyrophosphokinase [Chloroflexi bacterium]|nr:GTP pyrophosphokinase [Chloroflexota bacterium]
MEADEVVLNEGFHAPTIEDAIVYAVHLHRGQLYPSSDGEPFIYHPLRVMLGDEGEVERIAAVLHDVVEDTEVTLNTLRHQGYSEEIVEALDGLTRRAGEHYEKYIEQVAGNRIVRRVKLANLKDNLVNNRRLRRSPKTCERIVRYERAQHYLDSSATPDISSADTGRLT